VISAATITKPIAVRYAWANNPECSLVNQDNLPASPFRFEDKN
jgi:sialate O-acetylesterase